LKPFKLRNEKKGRKGRWKPKTDYALDACQAMEKLLGFKTNSKMGD